MTEVLCTVRNMQVYGTTDKTKQNEVLHTVYSILHHIQTYQEKKKDAGHTRVLSFLDGTEENTLVTFVEGTHMICNIKNFIGKG